MINNYMKKAVVLGLVMFAFLAAGFTVAPPVSAQGFPSDLCLRVIHQQNEDGPLPAPQRATINLHLASEDGKHFTIWGKVRIPGEPFYAGGTGILEGDWLTMNLTGSQKHTDGWRDSGVIQARYNIVTGRGVFYEIGHDFDTQNLVYDQRFSAGILRRCP